MAEPGARAIGGGFGTGPDRDIALIFTGAGAVGVLPIGAAFNAPRRRRLKTACCKSEPETRPAA